MLVDKKFIYLSLPRCASTSFFISAIRSGFTISHSNSKYDKVYENINLSNLSNMDLLQQINHFHETVKSLRDSFGNEYEIISVKRNRHERFVSYFNHCIGELYRNNILELYYQFQELEIDDVLFYTTENLINQDSKMEVIKKFLNNLGYKKDNNVVEKLLLPLISPLSTYHNNDRNIIWFDFNNLSDLEYWVTKKTNKPFKLEVFGSSKEYKSKISVNDYFIEKYNKIYDYYDIVKTTPTLI